MLIHDLSLPCLKRKNRTCFRSAVNCSFLVTIYKCKTTTRVKYIIVSNLILRNVKLKSFHKKGTHFLQNVIRNTQGRPSIGHLRLRFVIVVRAAAVAHDNLRLQRGQCFPGRGQLLLLPCNDSTRRVMLIERMGQF